MSPTAIPTAAAPTATGRPPEAAGESPEDRPSARIIAFRGRARAGEGLRRPRMLVRAAQAGQAGWKRERDLPRLLGGDTPPPGMALSRLAEDEAALDAARRQRAACYSVERHVAVLIALLAEMQARSAGMATRLVQGSA